MLRDRAAGSRLADDVARVCAVAQALDDSLDAVSTRMRPPWLEAGLGPALAAMARGWSTESGIPVDIAGVGDAGPASPLPDDVAVHLYRVAQEALHNVAKHAHAHTVRIRLLADAAAVCLAIEDDGDGFTPTAAAARRRSGGYGHTSLRERAAALGGTLRIRSVPGRGTALSLTVPLPAPPDDQPPVVAPGSSRATVAASVSRIRP